MCLIVYFSFSIYQIRCFRLHHFASVCQSPKHTFHKDRNQANRTVASFLKPHCVQSRHRSTNTWRHISPSYYPPPPQLHSLLEPTQSPNPKPRSSPNQAARLIWLCLTLEKLLGLMSFLWLVFYIHIWIDIYIVAYVFEIVRSNAYTLRLYFLF